MATPIPENRASFEWPLIVQATQGRASGPPLARVTGVTSDSRQVRPGSLFVALPGERFDGHDFIPQAVAAGAAGVLVEKAVVVPPNLAVCQVPSTLIALGELARLHRRTLAC